MYKLIVGENSYDLSKEDIKDLDLHREGNLIHILHNARSYNIKCLSKDLNKKKYHLEVNEEIYEVTIEDECDQLVNTLGFSAEQSTVITDIKAPMPGLVLKIFSKQGDKVVKGESLIILEAMKMENIIKSPIDGIIKSINVKEGDSVDKSAILIEFQ